MAKSATALTCTKNSSPCLNGGVEAASSGVFAGVELQDGLNEYGSL